MLTNYMYQERREEEDLPAMKSVDASIQRLDDYIQKCGERLITATKNNTNNTRTNRITITRKQKYEEKQPCGGFKRLMSSILTFSNKSVKLFTWKNRFLITAKVLHSIRKCLTVQVVWQVKHRGCGSCFKMKEWVSLVWPIRNLFTSWFSRCWSPLS